MYLKRHAYKGYQAVPFLENDGRGISKNNVVFVKNFQSTIVQYATNIAPFFIFSPYLSTNPGVERKSVNLTGIILEIWGSTIGPMLLFRPLPNYLSFTSIRTVNPMLPVFLHDIVDYFPVSTSMQFSVILRHKVSLNKISLLKCQIRRTE